MVRPASVVSGCACHSAIKLSGNSSGHQNTWCMASSGEYICIQPSLKVSSPGPSITQSAMLAGLDKGLLYSRAPFSTVPVNADSVAVGVLLLLVAGCFEQPAAAV